MVIYKITNLVNGKVYIGKTADMERRRAEHFKKRRHFVGKAIAKYGDANFSVETIVSDVSEENELNRLEMFWIEQYQSHDDRYGYNLTHGGEGGRFNEKMKAQRSGKNSWMYGKKHTKEAREKMSKARTGRKPTERQLQSLEKTWAHRRGSKLTPEHRAKIAASKIGSKLPENVLAKLRKPKTKEHCENMRRSFYRRNGTRLIEHNGEMHPIAEWARRFGISGALLKYRLDHGWNVEYALTKPAVGRWA